MPLECRGFRVLGEESLRVRFRLLPQSDGYEEGLIDWNTAFGYPICQRRPSTISMISAAISFASSKP